VLIRLILTGVIEVKGQLTEILKCLGDEEPRSANLAKLSFIELAMKDGVIYNNLPDGKLACVEAMDVHADDLFKSYQSSFCGRTCDCVPKYDSSHILIYRGDTHQWSLMC
jgi:hypothetical protein